MLWLVSAVACCTVIGRQVREHGVKVLVSAAWPAGFRSITRQGLRHYYCNQFRITDLWREPHRRAVGNCSGWAFTRSSVVTLSAVAMVSKAVFNRTSKSGIG